MKHTIDKIKNILASPILVLSLMGLGTGGCLTSCSEPESSLYEFTKDNTLSTPNDTLYSLLGVISKLQNIADRTVILGEIRGDLTSLTSEATLDLQDIANFTADASNPYNQASDYYAVIQNCNYFLTHADTTLTKRGEKVFEKEYAVIKTYRAWTYLQLAQIYGSVPFFTEPLLSEKDADPSLFPKYDIQQIAEYFINDLEPYVDTEYPSYGTFGSLPSRNFYIPVRVLLGDLCLWAGRYSEAAKYYHDYLTKTGSTHPTGLNSISWQDETFEHTSNGWANSLNNSSELITYIPMEEDEFDGTISYLDDIFTSTEDNNYYPQVETSPAHKQLSYAQRYTYIYTDPVSLLRDTISPPEDMVYTNENLRGDLRLSATYTFRNVSSSNANYNNTRQSSVKINTNYVTIYRLQHVYLRYAEALNRAGYPEAAFFVLKYGLCNDYTDKYLSQAEREAAGELIQFSSYTFTMSNTQGVHSRGSGNANADTTYVIPVLASRSDSILYVEEKILDEMALETAGEGLRFYDLMRIALRRDTPTLLADKVARRQGTLDSSLYSLLSDKSKWYLPLQ